MHTAVCKTGEPAHAGLVQIDASALKERQLEGGTIQGGELVPDCWQDSQTNVTKIGAHRMIGHGTQVCRSALLTGKLMSSAHKPHSFSGMPQSHTLGQSRGCGRRSDGNPEGHETGYVGRSGRQHANGSFTAVFSRPQ